MIPYLAWLLEFLLESAGTLYFLRRRTVLISLWLGFRAFADLLGMIALFGISSRAYRWVDYVSRNVSYVLFAAVCLYVVAQVLRESKHTRKFYSLAGPLVVLLAIIKFHSAPVTMQTAMVFEAWLCMILGACVAVAMAMRHAPKPWGLIACGLATQAGTEAAITIGRTHGFELAPWYPLGTIAALIVLFAAGFRDWRLEEARLPLGMKKPPTSVLAPRKIQARPM